MAPVPSALEILSTWERERVVMPLQNLRFLTAFSRVLEITAKGEFMLPLFACLYWCLDQWKCVAGIWLVPINEVVNGALKWMTRRGRPVWEDDRVRADAWSNEFSFPSSHAQHAAAIATFFVCSSAHEHAVTTTPLWLAVVYVLTVSISRVQLGIHYPTDVIVGAALGATSAVVHAAALPTFLALGSTSEGARFAGLAAPLLFCVPLIAASYVAVRRTERADPPEWVRNACRGKYAGRSFDPRGAPLASYTAMCGVEVGLLLGCFFKPGLPLAYPATFNASVGRAVVGNVGLMSVFEAVSALTPRQPLWLYSTLRFLKYVFVPTYILLLAPILFERLGVDAL